MTTTCQGSCNRVPHGSDPDPSGVLAMTPDAGYIKFVPGAVSLSKALAQSNGDAWWHRETKGFPIVTCQEIYLEWINEIYCAKLQSTNNTGKSFMLLCTVLYSPGIWTPLQSHGACQNAAENSELRICWHGLHQTSPSIWPKTRYGSAEGLCSNSWPSCLYQLVATWLAGFSDGWNISWGPAFVSRNEVREVSHLALELDFVRICLRELQRPNYKHYSIAWTVPKSASPSLLIFIFHSHI